MAVRGLGCPVRFTLTAGHKGDAPQAAALIEGLPAEVVMADTAYDADHLRQAIAAKGALAVIPTRHAPSNIRSTSISMPSAISSNAASQSSSNSAVSQPASKRPLEIIGRSSPSQPSFSGCGKCPHHLVSVTAYHSLYGSEDVKLSSSVLLRVAI
jgi:transposase